MNSCNSPLRSSLPQVPKNQAFAMHKMLSVVLPRLSCGAWLPSAALPISPVDSQAVVEAQEAGILLSSGGVSHMSYVFG